MTARVKMLRPALGARATDAITESDHHVRYFADRRGRAVCK